MNIIISGVCGFMGRELTKLIADGKQEMKALAGVDPAAESETQGVSAARADAVFGGTGFPFACSRSFSGAMTRRMSAFPERRATSRKNS